MEGSVLSFLKAEWKVSDTGSWAERLVLIKRTHHTINLDLSVIFFLNMRRKESLLINFRQNVFFNNKQLDRTQVSQLRTLLQYIHELIQNELIWYYIHILYSMKTLKKTKMSSVIKIDISKLLNQMNTHHTINLDLSFLNWFIKYIVYIYSKAKRMVLQCNNGVGSNPVEGRTKIWQL